MVEEQVLSSLAQVFLVDWRANSSGIFNLDDVLAFVGRKLDLDRPLSSDERHIIKNYLNLNAHAEPTMDEIRWR
ncbi:hypothetical protein KX729_33015 [Rhizobium sp. XQZ8]|uniref:hypothetical protein n=1 Tax=Rhizobium populisoli TaxID=2859785 RepID=UPI001CA52F63|nr:hypothetical protein [Rhizobium populisoli]MBW6426171.1 hypothetical protein [Rhizobium populisoli]